MFKQILIHVKHPYAVGVLIVIWTGTLIFYNIDNQLPITAMVILDSIVTLLITRHAMN